MNGAQRDMCPGHQRDMSPAVQGTKGQDNPPSIEGGCPLSPARLLTLKQAAAYLSVSYWSVRDFVLAGHIPTVQMPALRARLGDRPRASLRRVLIDRQDLDRFIEARKAASA